MSSPRLRVLEGGAPRERRPVPGHSHTLSERIFRWQAHCLCSWSSDEMATRLEADIAYSEHLATQRHLQGRARRPTAASVLRPGSPDAS